MKGQQPLLSVLLFLSCLDATISFAPVQRTQRTHSAFQTTTAASVGASFQPSQKNGNLLPRQKQTSLNAAAAAPAAVAAITGAITGGLFSGGLHAIAGEL